MLQGLTHEQQVPRSTALTTKHSKSVQVFKRVRNRKVMANIHVS